VQSRVGEEIKAWGGSKVLLHYGGGSVVRSGLLAQVEEALTAAGLEYYKLGGAQPNPRLSLVREGIALCREKGIDFILAVGGGSAIDSCKSIAVGVKYDGDVWDFYDKKAVPQDALPHANILTIAAAGSETSSSNVITNEDGWIKKGLETPFNRPKFTCMNPELLYTLPAYQTASGVVDIMMHTLDRYFSPGGVNEMTDRIAETLLKNVVQYGALCVKEPENYTARSEIMWAGSLSHNHLTGLGRKGDWAPHQIEHELSGKYDVAHGAGLASVWNAWARYVYKADVMRFARYAVNVWGVGMNYENPEETAIAGIEATVNFFASIGMPVTTTQLLGFTTSEEDMREMAHKCAHFGKRTIGSIKVLQEEDIYNVYVNAR